MWRILKAKYVELNSPSISENQYEDLLHGFAELVAIGQEKVVQDAKQLTKSRAALQSHLENHKVWDANHRTAQISIAGALFSVTGCSQLSWRRVTHRRGTGVPAENDEKLSVNQNWISPRRTVYYN